jgi:hypothetical protein
MPPEPEVNPDLPDKDPSGRFIEINGLYFELMPPVPWTPERTELTPDEMREAAQRYIEKHYGLSLTDWQTEIVNRLYRDSGGYDGQADK